MNSLALSNTAKKTTPDPFLLAMWLMYCRTPKQEKPDLDGSYSLGEIGTAPEKEWTRLTPYSIARKEFHGHDENTSSRLLDL